MAVMPLNVDRHIAIYAGWIAGPAFGVAMMAAPEYLHLGPIAAGFTFWGGIGVFVVTTVAVALISLHEEGKRRRVMWPIITMAIGALIFCGGAAWYFWPANEKAVAHREPSGASSRPDNFLHLECELADFVLPTDGKFYHFEAIYDGTQDPIAQFTQRWISEFAATTGPHILPGAN